MSPRLTKGSQRYWFVKKLVPPATELAVGYGFPGFGCVLLALVELLVQGLDSGGWVPGGGTYFLLVFNHVGIMYNVRSSP